MKNIYQAPKVLNQLILILAMVFSGLVVNSQNIAITDSAEYNAEISAMLDVQSSSKGLLVPRLTTAQRNAIASPATGLLVYDTGNSGFFYFDGSDWLNISQSTAGIGNALFAVLNANGDTVFAVYEDGARVIVPIGAKGKVGGFAVSGRIPSKADSDVEYLRVTPDSTRITFEEGAKGKVGGFAVSGRILSKAGTSTTSLINLFPDNYFIGDSAGINTTIGKYNSFFGYKSGKENTEGANNVFMGFKAGLSNQTASNNTFIGVYSGYNNLTGKNNIAMGYYAGYDLQESDYNVFIGDSVGRDNRTGDQNVYLGYNAGVSNIGGNQNIFIGYKAGYSNVGNTTGNDALDYIGSRNIFIGYEAGYVNTDGRFNVLVGQNAGRSLNDSYNTIIGYNAGIDATAGHYNLFLGNDAGKNNSGDFNSFIGPQAGQNNTTGYDNTYVGHQSGLSNTEGIGNTFIGRHSGRNNLTGSGNVFIGHEAGHSETGSNLLYIDNSTTSSPLIYGDFDTDVLTINNSSSTGNTKFFNCNAGGLNRFSVEQDGDVFMPELDMGTGTDLVINISTGEILEKTSSRRYKNEIASLDLDINKFMKLRPVTFKWNDKSGTPGIFDYGLIAEEVELIDKDWTLYKNGQVEGVDYNKMNIILLKVVQSQQENACEQQEQINKQQEQINTLIKELEELKK